MSESPRARLDALARRIEAAALDPDEIESKGLFRLATPLYRLAGYRARVQCVALGALGAALRSEEAKPDEERAAWWRAVEELAGAVAVAAAGEEEPGGGDPRGAERRRVGDLGAELLAADESRGVGPRCVASRERCRREG